MHSLVTVTAGAKSKALVELDTVKAQLGISGSAEDAELGRLIALAGAAVMGVHGLRRPPWRQTYNVRLPGDGGAFLLPPVWPIESVSRVLYGVTGSSEVASSTWSIEGEHRDCLYCPTGWVHTGSDFAYLLESIVAGWLMPDQVTTWEAAGSAIAAGAFTRPTTSASAAAQLLRYECTGGGTRGGTEPTWPTTPGAVITDGSVTWACRAASELPEEISQAALLAVQAYYDGDLEVPAGIQSERHGGSEVAYDFVGQREGAPPLPSAARLLLAGWIQP